MPGELTRDPRARRAVEAAHELGLQASALSALFDGSSPLPRAIYQGAVG